MREYGRQGQPCNWWQDCAKHACTGRQRLSLASALLLPDRTRETVLLEFPSSRNRSLPPFSSCPKTIFPRFPLVAEQLTYPSPADIPVLFSRVLQTNFWRSHPKKSNWDSIPDLIFKLSCLGFSRDSLTWLSNFLANRQQCINVNGYKSPWKSPKSGIPQGTVLGPVLFLVFIYYLQSVLKSFCSIFADDTTAYTIGKDVVKMLVKTCSNLLVNASIVGRALDGTLRFRRWKRSRAFSRRCHRSLATCQGMHGDAVKARPGREKTKWRSRSEFFLARPYARFDPEDSIPRIGCFLSAFVHLLQTLPKEVSRSTATKVESGISDANRRFLVCESLETGKEGQNACQKIQIEFVSKGSWTPMQWGKKQRTGLLNRHPFERKSSSIKAKGRQSHSTGFARDFGSIVAGTKPSGRTLDLYIYIYREWRKSESTRNCGARWGSPQSKDLDAASGWARTWGMLFNPEKSKHLNLLYKQRTVQ